MLSTVLLGKKDLSDYESFIKNSEAEDSALWHYNNALYHFKKLGKSTKSDKELLIAYKNNKYVVDYMLGVKEMPNEMPQFIGRGDENEGVAYVVDACPTMGKDGWCTGLDVWVCEREGKEGLIVLPNFRTIQFGSNQPPTPSR